MAVISTRSISGPEYKADIHLNMLYILFEDTQYEKLPDDTRVESNYNLIDIIVEEYAVDSFGNPDLDTKLGTEHFVIERSNLWQLKDPGLPEYSIRIEIQKSYYVVRMRLAEVIDPNNPGATIFSEESSFNFNNSFNWIYPESFQDLIDNEIVKLFSGKQALFIFGNILPVGGTTGDVQILNPSTAFCQEFAFNDFYAEGFYSASWNSSSTSWWEIEVSKADTYLKTILQNSTKGLLSAILNIPGILEIIKTKQQSLTEERIKSLYGVTPPDADLFIPFSFIVNDKIYNIIFIGDYNFIDRIKT